MADASNQLAITNQNNPTPSVPGTVDFTAPAQQVGNTTSPKPVIPSQMPPNVNGGDASFSATTSALADMVKIKSSELSAQSDALVANNRVDTTAATAISGLTDDTLSAMQRVQRIKQIPDEITQILGIFDKDWNIGYQAGRIDINQTKASQVSATATATKTMNNQLPALMANVSAASKTIFDAQVEANKLAIGQQHENTALLEAKIKKAQLGINMSQEQRAAAEFKVNSTPTAALTAQLADITAKGTKSPFFNMGGLIEHRLTTENQLITSLDDARGALADKNIDRFNKSMTNAASFIPPAILGPMVDKAEAAGQSVVNLPTGQKDKNGKDLFIPMPLKLAKDGMVIGMQTDNKANEMVSAYLTQKANIIPRITYLTNTAQSFVGMDPRAANVFIHASEIVKSINSKDPASIGRVDALLKQQETQMDQIVKENAEKFSSKEAQSAIIVAGKNGGKFDAIGGTAVAADSVGVPGFNTGARYSDAWGKFGTMVANEVSKQGMGFGAVNNTADAQSTNSIVLSKPGGREKINAIAKNIMADPQKMAPVRDAIKNKITDSAIGGVFTQLAQGKNANPIWANLAQAFHKDGLASFHNAKGNLDVPKLLESMEQATLLAKAHGNATADYSSNFIQGLQRYGSSGGDPAGSDPTYSISDRALEASLFNGDPSANVLNSLHYNMRQVAASVKQQFAQRIKEDLNGTTQRNTYDDMVKMNQLSSGGDPYTGSQTQLSEIYKKTGKNLSSIPSATGTGLTVAQVQQIMSAGH